MKAQKVPHQTEAELTKVIRILLKTLGIWHWKVHQGLGSTPGLPDICGIWQGKFLGIEVKTSKGKLSEHQVKQLRAIQQHGGIAIVARSVDDVIDGLGVQDRFLFGKTKKNSDEAKQDDRYAF
jgi:hypothetical protein